MVGADLRKLFNRVGVADGGFFRQLWLLKLAAADVNGVVNINLPAGEGQLFSARAPVDGKIPSPSPKNPVRHLQRKQHSSRACPPHWNSEAA